MRHRDRGEHQREFLAAVAVAAHVAADLPGQHVGDLAQRLVARFVAQGVVVGFEVVHVEHAKRQARHWFGMRQQLGQVVVEGAAVGQGGQAVGARQLFKPAVGGGQFAGAVLDGAFEFELALFDLAGEVAEAARQAADLVFFGQWQVGDRGLGLFAARNAVGGVAQSLHRLADAPAQHRAHHHQQDQLQRQAQRQQDRRAAVRGTGHLFGRVDRGQLPVRAFHAGEHDVGTAVLVLHHVGRVALLEVFRGQSVDARGKGVVQRIDMQDAPLLVADGQGFRAGDQVAAGTEQQGLRADQAAAAQARQDVIEQDVVAGIHQVPAAIVDRQLYGHGPLPGGLVEVKARPDRFAAGVGLGAGSRDDRAFGHIQVRRGLQSPGDARPVDHQAVVRQRGVQVGEGFAPGRAELSHQVGGDHGAPAQVLVRRRRAATEETGGVDRVAAVLVAPAAEIGRVEPDGAVFADAVHRVEPGAVVNGLVLVATQELRAEQLQVRERVAERLFLLKALQFRVAAQLVQGAVARELPGIGITQAGGTHHRQGRPQGYAPQDLLGQQAHGLSRSVPSAPCCPCPRPGSPGLPGNPW